MWPFEEFNEELSPPQSELCQPWGIVSSQRILSDSPLLKRRPPRRSTRSYCPAEIESVSFKSQWEEPATALSLTCWEFKETKKTKRDNRWNKLCQVRSLIFYFFFSLLLSFKKRDKNPSSAVLNIPWQCNRLSGCHGSCWLWWYKCQSRQVSFSSTQSGKNRHLTRRKSDLFQPRPVYLSTMLLK